MNTNCEPFSTSFGQYDFAYSMYLAIIVSCMMSCSLNSGNGWETIINQSKLMYVFFTRLFTLVFSESTLGESKILVTPGGSLPQKKIIHVYVDEGQILPAFKLALTQADRMKLSSVVIPVRPTGIYIEGFFTWSKDVAD